MADDWREQQHYAADASPGRGADHNTLTSNPPKESERIPHFGSDEEGVGDAGPPDAGGNFQFDKGYAMKGKEGMMKGMYKGGMIPKGMEKGMMMDKGKGMMMLDKGKGKMMVKGKDGFPMMKGKGKFAPSPGKGMSPGIMPSPGKGKGAPADPNADPGYSYQDQFGGGGDGYDQYYAGGAGDYGPGSGGGHPGDWGPPGASEYGNFPPGYGAPGGPVTTSGASPTSYNNSYPSPSSSNANNFRPSSQNNSGPGGEKRLFLATIAKKRSEQDAVLLRNRLKLLRQEEEKASKRIADTQKRASELLDLRDNVSADKERKKSEFIKGEEHLMDHRMKILKEKEMAARRKEYKELTDQKMKKIEYQRSLAERQEAEQALQVMREAHRRDAEENRKMIRRQKLQFQQQQQHELEMKKQQAAIEFEKKVQAEQSVKLEKEREISDMEKEEALLIKRLQMTQQRQHAAYEVLEDVIARKPEIADASFVSQSSRKQTPNQAKVQYYLEQKLHQRKPDDVFLQTNQSDNANHDDQGHPVPNSVMMSQSNIPRPSGVESNPLRGSDRPGGGLSSIPDRPQSSEMTENAMMNSDPSSRLQLNLGQAANGNGNNVNNMNNPSSADSTFGASASEAMQSADKNASYTTADGQTITLENVQEDLALASMLNM